MVAAMDNQLGIASGDADTSPEVTTGSGMRGQCGDEQEATDVHVESALDALSSQLSGAFSELTKLQHEVRGRMQAVADLQAEVARRESDAETSSREIAERQARVADVEAQLERQRVELDARSHEIEVRAADIERAAAQVAAKAEESSRIEGLLTNLERELDARAETLAARETVLAETLRSAEARESDLQSRSETLEREKADLAARTTALEELDVTLTARQLELTHSAQETEAAREELAGRESQVGIREEAVAAFMEMLARMHHALGEVTDETLRAAARAASDAHAALERQLSKDSARPPETVAPVEVVKEQPVPAEQSPVTASITDFTAEELSAFHVLRRMGKTEEEAIGRVRAGRAGTKRRSWFR